MKKRRTIIVSIAIMTIMIVGCNSKSSLDEMQMNENEPIIDLGSEAKAEETDAASQLPQSNIEDGYEKLLRVDFAAKTHVQVRNITEYYTGMEEKVQLTQSSQIPEELCDIILNAMEQGTEQETFTPLMVDTQISQEEFGIQTGVVLNNMETIQPAKVDADNDGIEDFIGLHFWGGTGGFSSMEFYKGSADGQYTLVSSFDCLLQEFSFIQYKGNQYLLMKEFDYNTKYYNGYSLYLYRDGILADGKKFSFVIDDYEMDLVHEDTSYEELDAVKNTLCNTKMPEILSRNDGVIYGTAETLYSDDSLSYEYSADIDNDGKQEYYNKSMWYPSNMGTVMSCIYEFEDSMILDDLCSRLSDEIGDGRLYTFWLDEVNGMNILYLYFGDNLDFSLYAYLISTK